MKNLIKELKISSVEIQHLLRAWIAISVAFAIVLGGVDSFMSLIILSGLTVGIGFLFHEMAHKFVAQRYNCFAEFRADNTMLVLMILMSFTGFLFAAPGAVIIHGNVTKRRNGIISVAGPMTNFVLAGIFLGLMFTQFKAIASFGAQVNAFLGLFNLLPFGNIDGKKVFDWDKRIYAGTAIIGVILLFLSLNL